jgi:predicted phosphodiesterase
MKIISYSDLHLEFGTEFTPPKNSAADLMILAGDIITFKNYDLLARFLKD